MDTIRLRGPIEVPDIWGCGQFWHRQAAEGARRFFRMLPGGLRVGVEQTVVGAWSGWFETSLPKQATGSNLTCLPLPAALAAAKRIWEMLDDVLHWQCEFPHASVARLDLVRDFTRIPAPNPLLAALARVPVPRYPAKLLGDHSNGRTVRRGPGKRRAQLYDKAAERRHAARVATTDADRSAALADGAAARGRLRFELRLRGRALRTQPVEADRVRWVADLTEDRLARLRRRYFDRAGFGHAVAGMVQIVDVVLADPDLSGRGKLSLLGYLAGRAAGPPPAVSPPTERSHRRAADRLRLTPAAGTVPAIVAAVLADPGLRNKLPLLGYHLCQAAGRTPPVSPPTQRSYRETAARLGLTPAALAGLLAPTPVLALDYASGTLTSRHWPGLHPPEHHRPSKVTDRGPGPPPAPR